MNDYHKITSAYGCSACKYKESFNGVKPSAISSNFRTKTLAGRERDFIDDASSVATNFSKSDDNTDSRSHKHRRHSPSRYYINNNYNDYPYNYYNPYTYYPALVSPPIYQPISFTFWQMIQNNIDSYPNHPTEYDAHQMANYILNLSRVAPCSSKCKQYIDYFISIFFKSNVSIYKFCESKENVKIFFDEFRRDINNNFSYDIYRTESGTYYM
jgi:hypothetical protein